MKKKVLLAFMVSLISIFALAGTCVYAAETVNVSTVSELQSAHPYTNNMDKTWVYTHSTSAQKLSVTFSSDTKTESNYDYIYIYDGSGNQIGTYTGTTLAGTTVTVNGNVVKIQLKSDGSQTYYGFRVTNISPTSSSTSTYHEHPICGLVCNCEGITHPSVRWYAWNGKSSIGNSYYYLTGDVSRTSYYQITGSVRICLNDHCITTNGEVEGLCVTSTGNLTITDCGTNGEICSDDGDDYGSSNAEVAIGNYGTFKLYNGKLSGGAGIWNYSTGEAIIYGGVMYGSDWGGLYNQGSAQMVNGELTGRLGLDNEGYCDISNVTVYNDVSNSGTLNIEDCSIYAKPEYSYGGIMNSGTLNAESVEIFQDENTTSHSIYNYQSGVANLKDVKLSAIKNNTYNIQYFGVYNAAPNAKCYIYGDSEVAAIKTDYPNTISFASSDGTKKLLSEKPISVCLGSDIGDNSTVISNISENQAKKITQINDAGEPEEQNGILLYSYGSLKYKEHYGAGTFGKLTWKLTYDGTLIISGKGDMQASNRPWYSKRTNIKKIVIEDGVTSIADYAFDGCVNVTEVIIGNSVTSIGYEAFQECEKLQSINIPDSVVTIDSYVFEYCEALSDVYIGKGLQTLDHRTFRYNNVLAYHIDSENPYFKSIDGHIFTKDGKTLVRYAIGKTNTDYVIPEGTETIGFAAFEGTTNLKNVYIPSSVKIITSDAFWMVDSYLAKHYLNDVYYDGSKSQWEKVYIDWNYNYALEEADMHFSKYDVVIKEKNSGILVEYVVDSGSLISSEYVPQKDGCKYKLYLGENMEEDFDLNTPITSDVVIVVEYVSHVIIGDSNGDGKIDVKDAISIRRIITGGYGTTIVDEAADVNKDGEISVKDVIMIRRFITGGYGVEL